MRESTSSTSQAKLRFLLGFTIRWMTLIAVGLWPAVAIKYLDWEVLPYVVFTITTIAVYWAAVKLMKLASTLLGRNPVYAPRLKSRFGLAVQSASFGLLSASLLLTLKAAESIACFVPWMRRLDQPLSFMQCSLLLAIAYLNARLSVVVYRIGRRLRVSPLENNMKNDSRRSVVYLRAFFHDSPLQPSEWDSTQLFFLQAWNDITATNLEEQIVRHFMAVGPVHALGKPGEVLSPTGAIRRYVADDEWQEVVASMMKASAITVIRLASTANVEWECDYAIQNLAPEQLILLVAPSAGKSADEIWGKFRTQFGSRFPKGLPADARICSVESEPCIHAVEFTEDWSPRQFVAIKSQGVAITLEERLIQILVFVFGLWLGADLTAKTLSILV